MSDESGASVADVLDRDAAARQGDVERLSHRIEVLEREIVEARAEREEAARRMVEMRAAANILREVGLRSSIVKGVPYVEMDYQPKRPADEIAALGLSDEQAAILRDHVASRQQTVAEFLGDVLMDFGLGRATGKDYPPPSVERLRATPEPEE